MKLRSVILVLLALGLALSLPAPTDYKEEGELLVSCGLGHLVNRFREEEIDRNIMQRLGDVDQRELGLNSMESWMRTDLEKPVNGARGHFLPDCGHF